ncbi:DUF1906 domain-containing protein [Nocardioides panacisoli]|uniref:glycoside hydrolase domain-containing protein n=1 Tax=Nocardioides panacisoli TaxID=627624 RepID=UPI001C633EE3|nr:glycoside hydrolase domain-containing protein [Nocardioides panacisoli]QYJ02852.1 DUF1906 domain-containing protein [Nocardioides panacisoli]
MATAAAAALAVSLLPGNAGDRAGGSGASEAEDRLQLVGTNNPVTPGNFNGYAFDQCEAPSQKTMNTWLNHSPYLGVGIYIAGDQRFCREQANITPKWISTQLNKGWKLLPIILGPQASCQPRFPRWGGKSITPWPGKKGNYWWARQQGREEAKNAVAVAQRLGIVKRSTLFYDLEGFDISNRDCRESALAFLNAWTVKVKSLGYLSGVYSSAGSGIKALDNARKAGTHRMPDQIWIARWDGKANTSTTYIGEQGWRPGGRLKQYLGGHNETYGGTTINIDSNYVDLGRGMHAGSEKHCGGVDIDLSRYRPVRPKWTGSAQRPVQTKALQCLLKEKGYYDRNINGHYWPPTRKAVKAWQRDQNLKVTGNFWRYHWVALLSQGNRNPLKFGSAGSDVRRAQRALNAAFWNLQGPVDGRYTKSLGNAVERYRKKVGQGSSEILHWGTWKQLQRGKK